MSSGDKSIAFIEGLKGLPEFFAKHISTFSNTLHNKVLLLFVLAISFFFFQTLKNLFFIILNNFIILVQIITENLLQRNLCYRKINILGMKLTRLHLNLISKNQPTPNPSTFFYMKTPPLNLTPDYEIFFQHLQKAFTSDSELTILSTKHPSSQSMLPFLE